MLLRLLYPVNPAKSVLAIPLRQLVKLGENTYEFIDADYAKSSCLRRTKFKTKDTAGSISIQPNVR